MSNLCRLVAKLFDSIDELEDKECEQIGRPKWSDIIFSEKDKELIWLIRKKGAEKDD